jgi:hypothetical protein
MSEKAVGYDWKSRSKLTLRHGAGLQDSKFIQQKAPVDHSYERKFHNKTCAVTNNKYAVKKQKVIRKVA